MSLLNDALKRASQSQQQQLDTVRIHLPPATEPLPEPPRALPPVAVAAARPNPARGLAISVLAVLVMVGMGALIRVVFVERKPVPHATALRPVPAVAVTKPAPPKPKAKTVAVNAPAPLPWPRLKVQGITYYDGKWQAIVNGRTVYVGYSMNGIRIAKISQYRVSFVAPDGSKKTMLLGE